MKFNFTKAREVVNRSGLERRSDAALHKKRVLLSLDIQPRRRAPGSIRTDNLMRYEIDQTCIGIVVAHELGRTVLKRAVCTAVHIPLDGAFWLHYGPVGSVPLNSDERLVRRRQRSHFQEQCTAGSSSVRPATNGRLSRKAGTR